MNYQTQHLASPMHQPAKVTQIILILDGSKRSAWPIIPRPSQSWQNHWLEHSPKFVGSNRLSRFVVVPFAQQMAKRTCPLTDEASRYTGTSSKSKPEGKKFSRWCSAASKELTIDFSSRQDATLWQRPGESEPGTRRAVAMQFSGVQALGDWLRMVQQSEVPSQENPGQASRSLRTRSVRLGGHHWMPKREQQSASSSSGRKSSQNPSAQASGDRLQF